MNTPLKDHSNVKAHQQSPMPQKASEPPDAVWLRQSCVEAGADEVSCVKIVRRPSMTIALLAGWLTVALMAGGCSKPAVKDPRLQSPRVEVFKAKAAGSNGRTFTGIVEARVQSDLGFRVAGKILERSVDVGERVQKGQPLMRLDPEDLRLSAAAQQANVEAARAKYTQAKADETRSGTLVKSGVISPREYDQDRAALDSAKAQLEAAEAQERVSNNSSEYAILLADADGVIVRTLSEPGQVVAAGQTVIQLAHDGPREALINLPEGVRPDLGMTASARLCGQDEMYQARLRQLSDAADPASRTFEARYVLEGEAASAPLGSTFTITLFFILASAGAGIYAYFHLGRAEDPSFTIKVLTVTAVWPGATAQEMQDLVAEPLEKRLQELRWYDRVETITRPGLALMTLQLIDKTPPKEVPDQFYQARKKLGDEARKLPQGGIGPFVNDEYSDVSFALYSVEAPGFPLRRLTRVAEELRQRFLHVPGVKKVDIVGEQQERIFVDFSYSRLTMLGISPADVFSALSRQNAVTPAGSIDTDGAQVFVRLEGAYTDIDKIRDTPIAAGRQSFKLSDIAEVTKGYEDPATFVIRHNGESSLLLSIVMKEGWNGLDLGDALRTESEKISASLPLGVSLKKITDQAVNISSAVNEFMIKFAMAVGVVMLVSLLSLGWRVGIVVVAAVPLTLGAVFVIMMITDRVFDRITLGALIISLGLLVDDAIIAIESMVVEVEEGLDRIQAASYGLSHTAAPTLAGTLVTVIGFLPVGFARSTAGEYAGNIFWIVGFSLIASWIVAVVFTPYLGVKLLPQIKTVKGGHEGIYSTPRYQRFRHFVALFVGKKYTVASIVVGAFLMAGGGMAVVKKQFFPNSDRS